YNTNPKHLPDDQPVFIQQIDFPNRPRWLTAQSTLKTLRINNLDEFESDALVFTGYPYREWNGKYLSDAVFSRLIPLVTVLAWQSEAQRTTGYLLKRIRNAGFDNYMPQWINSGIPDWDVSYRKERPDESSLIIQKGNTGNSISTFLAEQIQMETTFEDVQQYISHFRFANLPTWVNDAGHYLVPVNVLYFHDGSYMLLPNGRGGRVHFVSRLNRIAGEIREASFRELSVGDVVVCFNMDREVVRRLAREQLNEAYKYLDIWRHCLKRLLDINEGQLTGLEQYLSQQKELLHLSAGSPTKNNILRWFYESDMLAPQTPNLYLILQVSGLSKPDAEVIVNQIKAAKSLIIKNSNQVSDRIKDKIITVLSSSQMPEDDILLDIGGVSVAVQCGR
ncbi:MAG: hypothetical protein J7497_17635, partial [Chitinophagaceae bacterium]|nr:hypothetical protein [Chitinophagaceae bacterium]